MPSDHIIAFASVDIVSRNVCIHFIASNHEVIISFATKNFVISESDPDNIIAITCVNVVVTSGSFDEIMSRSTEDYIVIPGSNNLVIAGTTVSKRLRVSINSIICVNTRVGIWGERPFSRYSSWSNFNCLCTQKD